MTRQFVLLLVLPFILTSCIPDEGLKRSANNKLLDTQGFHGKKRRPLYNNKYIDKAKHNVSRSELDMDEYDEDEKYLGNLNPSIRNRYMYEDMVEEDMESEKVIRAKKRAAYLKKLDNRDRYYNLGNARDKVRNGHSDEENTELRRELLEIKSMLNSARKDLVKYRCPVDEDGEIIVKKHGANPQKSQEEVHSKPKPAPKKAPVAVQNKPKPKPVAPKPKVPTPPAPTAKVQNVNKPASLQQPKEEVIKTPSPAVAPAQNNNVTQQTKTPAIPAQKRNVPQIEEKPVAPTEASNVAEIENMQAEVTQVNNSPQPEPEPVQVEEESLNRMSSKLGQSVEEDVDNEEVSIPTLPNESNVSQSPYEEQSVPSLPQFPITE